MALSANQVPIHLWPLIAGTYMHLRLILTRFTTYSEAAEDFNRWTDMSGHIIMLLEYEYPRGEADLKNFSNYLQNLLQEIEEELQ